MALYLGNTKSKINFRRSVHSLKFFVSSFVLNGAKLLSSNEYTLKDINGTYLTVKESE